MWICAWILVWILARILAWIFAWILGVDSVDFGCGFWREFPREFFGARFVLVLWCVEHPKNSHQNSHQNSHANLTSKFLAQICTQIHTQNHAQNHIKIHSQVDPQNSQLNHLTVGRQRTAVYFGIFRWGLEGQQRADAGQCCVLGNFGMDWEDSGCQTAGGGVYWDSVPRLKFTTKKENSLVFYMQKKWKKDRVFPVEGGRCDTRTAFTATLLLRLSVIIWGRWGCPPGIYFHVRGRRSKSRTRDAEVHRGADAQKVS